MLARFRGSRRLSVVLHIGPHKTGTTTIQNVLAQQVASDGPKAGALWYPRNGGQNHNPLVLDFLAGSEQPLTQLLQQARAAKASALLLSAEAFCIADAAQLSRLAAVLDGCSVDVVATLNSPLRRGASMWQELVKHKFARTLDEAPDRVLRHPGFQAELLPRFVDALQTRRAAAVFSASTDSPDALIRRFGDAVGLALEAPAESGHRRNSSLGLIEAEMWRHMNAVIKAHRPEYMHGGDYAVLRRELMRCFSSSAWQEACPRLPIPLPTEVSDRLQQLGEATHARIVALAQRGSVEIYGAPEALLEPFA